MRKFLAGIIAVAMLVTSLSTMAFAEEAIADDVQADATYDTVKEYEGTEYYNAVKLLSALKIMEGKEDGDFAPEDTLTRSEMSAIAIRFLGMGTLSSGVEDAGYIDVGGDYWGKPYIDMATAMGLLNGNGDGTFAPENSVTAEEAIKILVSALGYDAKAKEKGGYPAGYLSVANQLEIMKGVSFPKGYSTALPRWKIAILVFNALKADIMEKKVYGDKGYYAVSEEVSALKEYHKIEKKTGVVDATYVTSFNNTKLDPEDVIIDGVQYTTELDFEAYLGYSVEFYYTIDTDLAEHKIIAFFVKTEDSDRIEIAFEDVSTIEVTSGFDVNISYYQNENSREKKLNAKNPVIMYNGKAEHFATPDDLKAFLDANCNQGRFIYVKETTASRNVLFVENYDAYVVSMVDAKNERLMYNIYEVGAVNTDIMDLSTDEAPDRKIFIYDEDENEISLSDLAPEDVIMVYVSSDKNLYKIHQSKSKVSGKVGQRDAIEGTITDPIEWIPPEPRPTPYWETMLETNMDGYTTTNSSGTPQPYTGKSLWSVGTVNGEKVHLDVCANTGGVGGMYYPGQSTGFVSPASWNITDGAPAIMGENVLLTARDNTPGGGWASPGTGPIFQSIYAGNQFEEGDKLRITAWVRANRVINEFSTTAAAGTLQDLEDQTTPFGVRMWLGKAWNSENATEYNTNGYKTDIDFPTLNTTMVADKWVELTLDFTYTAKFATMANSVFIDNRPDSYAGQPYPQRLFLAGIRLEKYVDPDSGYIEPRPDIPIDATQYDIYIDGTKYEPVSNFTSSLLKLGDDVTLYLDGFGKVVGYTTKTANKNYALLLNAGLKTGAFKDTLMLKLLGTDNVVREYETLPEIEAFDGTKVRKMPVGELITNQPADPYSSYYIWSTNNASNFECVPRVWLSEKDKSDAASRKIIYFELNKDGKIDKVLVPSMPEDHPDAKIVMAKDFGYSEEYDDALIQTFWPKWITQADYSHKQHREYQYRYLASTQAYMAWANDYKDEDYSTCTDWRYTDNIGNALHWDFAQLYRYPGSKTIDFYVMNGDSAILFNKTFNAKNLNILVDKVIKTEDGFTVKGYDLTSSKVSHDITFTIREGLRLFENNWATSPDAGGEKITWDNVAKHIGEIPYKVAYESDVMGNRETPYVDETTLSQGDIIKVIMNSGNGTNEALYVGMLRDFEDGIPAAYHEVDPAGGDSIYTWDGIVYGEVVDINYRLGTFKVKGYYWTQDTYPYSRMLAAQSGTKKQHQITEMTFDIFMQGELRCWFIDEERYNVGSFRDIEIGDKYFSIGDASYPYIGCVLFKD